MQSGQTGTGHLFTTAGTHMHKIYFRFFRFSSGPLLDEMRRIAEHNREIFGPIKQLCDELGATAAITDSSGRVVGLRFDVAPDPAVWLDVNPGHKPRQNTREGRAIKRRMDALPRPISPQSALATIGLMPGFPALSDRRNGYAPVMGGSLKRGVLFVKVPWRDVSAEQLARYREDSAAGRRSSAEMDHLGWVPPAEAEEIKEWQFLKEMEEISQEPSHG